MTKEPANWEDVENAPVHWLFRRLPRRFRGAALVLLVLLIGIPSVWHSWETIVGMFVTPSKLSFLVLPHHDVPYGMAYLRHSDRTIDSIPAYPIYNVDMHQAVVVQPLTDLKDVIRDGYRITLGNPTDHKLLVTKITMHVRRRDDLPTRYVCAWKQKGVEQVVTADFDLRPGVRETSLLDDTHIIDIPSGEAQVIVARVRDATPGVYTFYFSAEVQSVKGKMSTVTSQDFRLFVPNRDDKRPEPRGVSLITNGNLPELVNRILAVDRVGWEKLRDASNPRSLDAELAIAHGVSAKGNDDAAFVDHFIREATLPPPGNMRPLVQIISGCVEGTDDAAPCATTLLALGQVDQAGRVLRDGLARNPSDAASAAKLIRLLLSKRQPTLARQVWDAISTRASPNADLYEAGFTLAQATSNHKLEEQLARDSALQFPDSIELLTDRTIYYRTADRTNDALHALAAGCQNFEKLHDTSRRRLLRRLVRDTTILLSNQGHTEVGKWLPVILARCPSQIAWDLRTSPALWHYASMARPFAQQPTNSREGLERVHALIATHRNALAGRELSYVAHHGTSSDVAEAEELFGDALFQNADYLRSGDAYLSAYRQRSLSKLRTEAIIVKAAFAFYQARSKRLDDLFTAIGLRVMRFAEAPPGTPPPSEDLSSQRPVSGSAPVVNANTLVLVDPPWESQRNRGLVWLVRGFATRSLEVTSEGLRATMTSDPVFALGHTGADADELAAFRAVVDAIRAWRQSGKTPALPTSTIAYFMNQYLSEQSFFQTDDTITVEDYPTRTEAVRALLAATDMLQKSSHPYLVRTRGGITCGLTYPGHDDVFTGQTWVPFAEFQTRERPRHRTAKPGVYLEKVTGAQLAAERLFRHGVELAYTQYDIDDGLREIEGAITQDATNIEALRIGAQLNAVSGNPRRCAQLADRGLTLDPDAAGLTGLAKGCRAVIR